MKTLKERRTRREKRFSRWVKKRGGRILSPGHYNANDPVKVKCACGHVWQTKPYSLAASWCPQCAENAPVTVELVRQLVEYRGGELVDPPEEITNKKARLRFRCESGHEWETGVRQIWEGHWCPQCAGNVKGTIEEMRVLAYKAGGRCLSAEYVNSKTKLQWQCEMGHIWWAAPSLIKGSKNRKGSWCRECWLDYMRGRIHDL